MADVRLPRLGLPIDGKRVRALLIAAPFPVQVYGSEEQKTNADGVLLWAFPVLLTVDNRSEEIRLKVAAPDVQGAQVGEFVELGDLVAFPWVMDGGNRAGIAWHARAIRFPSGAVLGV